MENIDHPKIEVQTTEDDPKLAELEDQIAELFAQALYAHILRKGILKRSKKLTLDPTQ